MATGKAAFIKEMMSSYRRFSMTPEEIEGVKELTARILDFASMSVNKAQLCLFGSLVSGFCKRGTDADFSLTYRNFSPWLQGFQRLDEQDRKRLVRFAREASRAGMTEVACIHAVIPVVQFVDPHSTIHCDVTIGNIGGVVNSKILGKLREIYPDFYGAYIHTVKQWGKARELVAPAKGTFNSFTLTVMALMVLQELALLPLFGHPSGELGELTEEDAEKVVEKFTLPRIYEDLYGDDDKLGEAVFFCFQKFAEYYSKFDFVNGTVSLLCPRRERRVYAQITRKYLELFAAKKRQVWTEYIKAHPEDGPLSERDLQEAVKFEEVQHNSETPFIVEDFVNYINCGRRVHPIKVKYIADEFERLAEIMHPRNESSIVYDDVMKCNTTLTDIYPDKYHDPKVQVF